MRFEWDERKNQANRAKHGIGFDVARLVFDDPLHLSTQDRNQDGEERRQTVGRIRRTVVLLVAHTDAYADGIDVIRIISARKATRQERKRYEHGE